MPGSGELAPCTPLRPSLSGGPPNRNLSFMLNFTTCKRAREKSLQAFSLALWVTHGMGFSLTALSQRPFVKAPGC